MSDGDLKVGPIEQAYRTAAAKDEDEVSRRRRRAAVLKAVRAQSTGPQARPAAANQASWLMRSGVLTVVLVVGVLVFRAGDPSEAPDQKTSAIAPSSKPVVVAQSSNVPAPITAPAARRDLAATSTTTRGGQSTPIPSAKVDTPVAQPPMQAVIVASADSAKQVHEQFVAPPSSGVAAAAPAAAPMVARELGAPAAAVGRVASAKARANPALSPIACVQTHDRDCLVRALESGAPIDAADESGKTALIHAVVSGQVDLVRELLGKGASPALPDVSGLDARSYARLSGDPVIRSLLTPGG